MKTPQLITDKVNQIQDQFNVLLSTEFMLTVATIVAFWYGVVRYAYRAVANWYTNGGKRVMINNACKMLAFVNRTAESVYYHLEDVEQASV